MERLRFDIAAPALAFTAAPHTQAFSVNFIPVSSKGGITHYMLPGAIQNRTTQR